MPPAKGEPRYRSNSAHCSYNPIEVPWAAELCCYEDVPGCRGGKCATARQLISPQDHCGDLARTFVFVCWYWRLSRHGRRPGQMQPVRISFLSRVIQLPVPAPFPTGLAQD